MDGAIHRAAGPELLAECRTIGGCPTGEARITGGYGLQADHVIHTVGPVWCGGDNREAELLASCYAASLSLGRDHRIRSIAFPAISTGIYGFPKKEASIIAAATVRDELRRDEGTFDRILFVCFDELARATYARAVSEVAGG